MNLNKLKYTLIFISILALSIPVNAQEKKVAATRKELFKEIEHMD